MAVRPRQMNRLRSRQEQDRFRREWERAVRAAGVDPWLWFMHFGFIFPGYASCRDCLDYRLGICGGGIDPVVCKRHPREILDGFSVEGNP